MEDPKGPIFEPLIRHQSSIADAAGNLYVVNNWKPSLFVDLFEKSPNPGGDAVVIFIGCAAPWKLT
jgi:hypothetical protein